MKISKFRRIPRSIVHCATVLLVVFLGSRGSVGAQTQLAGLPFAHHFSTKDYQGGIQNWQIKQDYRGVLLVANNFGVLEFDGKNWRTHVLQNGIKVRTLDVDSTGKVYVGSQGDFGYLESNEQGRWVYHSLAAQLPAKEQGFDETWRVYVDGDRVFFCTFEKIFIYEHGKFTIISPPGRLEPAYLVRGVLYVHVEGLGLCYYEEGASLKLLPGGELFKDRLISSVIPFRQSELLISTYVNGMYHFDGQRFSRWATTDDARLEKAIINCSLGLSDGRIAIGTQSAGLFLFDHEGQRLLHMDKDQGLDNRTVLSLYEDKLNNLWVGLNNGISYVELSSPFTMIDDNLGVPGTGYTAYLDDDYFYLGTGNGVYRKSRRVPFTEYELVPGSQGQVYDLQELRGQLLVGHHNGTYVVENGRARLIDDNRGGWIYRQWSGNPDLMIGGTYSGLVKYRWNNGWESVKTIPGLQESSRVMEVTPDGVLWMTHGYKGAYRMEFTENLDSISSLRHYDGDDGFPSNVLINVFPSRNGLVFPAEQGIFEYSREHDLFQPNPLYTELLGEDYHIGVMHEDQLGNMYFIGTGEVGILRRNTLGEYSKETRLFNKIIGLLNDDLENLTVLSNDEVIFGAKSGFIHFDPKVFKGNEMPFHTLLRQVSGGEDSVLYGGAPLPEGRAPLALDYAENSLRFSYSAPYFDGFEQLEYSYYLENFDETWSEWSEKTEKEYTNLPEGKYTFWVKARNIYSRESASVSYTFTIAPPWFRSPWAYALYGLGAVGILFLGFAWQARRHNEEKRQLEEESQVALHQKDHELKSVTERSEAEITRLRNEKLRAEVKHKNKELATSTMHLMNKNAFISGVKTNLNSLKKKSSNQTVQKELNKIVKEIDRNLSDNQDWEQFQFHFDQVHGDFSQRLRNEFPNLTAQEMRLVAYLRLNLNTKEIAQLLNISVRGVEISRYRLRKKLNLDRSSNLAEFILNY